MPAKSRTFIVTTAAVAVLSAVIFGTALSVLSGFTSIFPLIGWLGIIAIMLFSIGMGLASTTIKHNRIQRFRQLRRPKRSTMVALTCAMALLLGSVMAGYQVVRDVLPRGGQGPADHRIIDQTGQPPTREPVSDDEIVFHYIKLAKAPGQDRDLNFQTGGYVRQTFTAKADVIQSVNVIISRPPEFGGKYSENNLGNVRLMVHEVNENNDNVGDGIPLQLRGSSVPPSLDGVVQSAGPNHRNTVFRIAPARVQAGKRYAFTVVNEEPGAVLAFSLNTELDGSDPMDSIGALNGDRREVTYFHVAGFVCNLANCE